MIEVGFAIKAQLPHVYNYWKGGGPLEQNCIPISRNARISKDFAETGFDGPRILNAWNARIQISLRLRLRRVDLKIGSLNYF